MAPVTRLDEVEADFVPLDHRINPLQEHVDTPERQRYLQELFTAYCAFADTILRVA